jgi:hypothetical protein
VTVARERQAFLGNVYRINGARNRFEYHLMITPHHVRQ